MKKSIFTWYYWKINEIAALFPFSPHFLKNRENSVNKVCISIINCHSGNTFKIEGFLFVFKSFCSYNGKNIMLKSVGKWKKFRNRFLPLNETFTLGMIFAEIMKMAAFVMLISSRFTFFSRFIVSVDF